jgi:hypothetical protein
MRINESAFSHDTVALMGGVCDVVWKEARRTISFGSADRMEFARRRMANTVMQAVLEGERDVSTLRRRALDCLCDVAGEPDIASTATEPAVGHLR